MKRFGGRTVIVTGAASGIGYEMARLFHDEGALVIAGDVRDTVPEGCIPVIADVSEERDVRALVDRAVDEAGRIDILCNNAGVASTTDAVACTLAEWERTFAVNVRGVFLGTKFTLPHMLASGGGVIINTASVAGLIGLVDRAAYCASKGAVIAFTRQIAVQYARQGIRCNCICPGTVDTPWVGKLLAQSEEPTKLRDALVARQPLGRLATATEIARAAMYLASDDASFVTGAALNIDGGILAG